MLQESGKYFYVPCGKEEESIDSKIRDLELIISIALSMKRIPIIEEEKFSLICDGCAISTSINWEQYIDLSKTRILKIESGGIKELSDTLCYLRKRDFDLNSYPKGKIRYIDSHQLYDEENEQYPVVCLLQSKDTEKLQLIRSKPYPSINENRFDIPTFLIIFSFSQEVNGLTDIVLDYFGTRRENMKLLSDIFSCSFREQHLGGSSLVGISQSYACMNLRYEKNIGATPRLINKYVATMKVQEVIRKVRKQKGKKLPFYIISDTASTGYLHFLSPKQNVYRYGDFRELKERFTQSKMIDHNLLYLVEDNIMRHAVIKILPAEMNNFSFEGPWNNWFGINRSLVQKINLGFEYHINKLMETLK